MTTFTKNGIQLQICLNADGTVNCNEKMEVTYMGKTEYWYPDKVAGKNYGTVADRFEYVESVVRFRMACDKLINEG